MRLPTLFFAFKLAFIIPGLLQHMQLQEQGSSLQHIGPENQFEKGYRHLPEVGTFGT